MNDKHSFNKLTMCINCWQYLLAVQLSHIRASCRCIWPSTHGWLVSSCWGWWC